MKNYNELVNDALSRVGEVMPWDLNPMISTANNILLLDVREAEEFDLLHIPGSINVPRGILEQACEWDYDETVPALVNGRSREIIVICRSGKRSVLAAETLQLMGFTNVKSLKTGVRGWNDSEQPLQNISRELLDPDDVDILLTPHVRVDQRKPKP